MRNREPWRAVVHGLSKSGHDLATEQQQQILPESLVIDQSVFINFMYKVFGYFLLPKDPENVSFPSYQGPI